MAIMDASGACFVECGFTALRDPTTGDFLPSVPLYIRVDKETIDKRTGLAACEKELCVDIAAALGEKFGQYVRGTQKEARHRAKQST